MPRGTWSRAASTSCASSWSQDKTRNDARSRSSDEVEVISRGLPCVLVTLALTAPGTCAGYFETLDVSSRSLAFGEAYVALAADASGVAWNPAGLGALDHLEMQLSLSRP